MQTTEKTVAPRVRRLGVLAVVIVMSVSAAVVGWLIVGDATDGTSTETTPTDVTQVTANGGPVDAAALPETGLGVVTDAGLALFTLSGETLGTLSTRALDDLDDPRATVDIIVDGPSVTIDIDVPPDRPAFGDCRRLHGAIDVELPAAVCDEGIDLLDPGTGERVNRARPPGDGDQWSWVLVSPDGEWLAGLWDDPAGSPTRLFDRSGRGDGTPLSGHASGWTDDNRLVVAEALDQPRRLRVRLVAPAFTGDGGLPLVEVPGGTTAIVWHRAEPPAPPTDARNARERRLGEAFDVLGVEECCGEPSHGSESAVTGMVWDGWSLFVHAGPVDGEPFLERAPVSFICGDTRYTIEGLAHDTPEERIVEAAIALAGVLGCDGAAITTG